MLITDQTDKKNIIKMEGKVTVLSLDYFQVNSLVIHTTLLVIQYENYEMCKMGKKLHIEMETIMTCNAEMRDIIINESY